LLRTIDIDDGVWQALQTRVKHFEETPNDVLRRVLNVNGSATRGRNLTPTVKNRSKDSRQDRVRAIIEATVARDPDMELLESNRVRIHFAPRAWTAPELMRGSTKSGKILQFVVVNRPTKLRLHMVICPGDHDTRRRIRESLQNQSWFSAARRRLPPMWHRIFRKDILHPRDYENHGENEEWIQGRITEMLADFKLNDFPQIDRAVRAIEF